MSMSCARAACLLFALSFAATAGADDAPVLEYVKPGVEVQFVSATASLPHALEGWYFQIRTWSAYDADEVRVIADKSQHVTLAFENGRISGQGTCNTLTGSYKLQDQALTISELARSKKMCADSEVMKVEDKLLAFLGRVSSMERIGPNVVLRGLDDDDSMVLWGIDLAEIRAGQAVPEKPESE